MEGRSVIYCAMKAVEETVIEEAEHGPVPLSGIMAALSHWGMPHRHCEILIGTLIEYGVLKEGPRPHTVLPGTPSEELKD